MTIHPDRDKSLVDDFLSGDEKAFVAIYDQYWYRLFLAAYRRVKDKDVAEELVQNLFLKLWEKRGRIPIENLEKYLFSSIRNATIDFLNKQMVAGKYLDYQRIYTSLKENTTENMVVLNDLKGALEKALHSLSGKSEEIFRLYRIDNWPVERIASHLNLSEKAVHYHLTRSQKFVRSFLQEFTLVMLILFSRL